MERYCEQLKKCIEVAFKCVESDRHKRPNIGDVIRMLDETDTSIHDAGKVLGANPIDQITLPIQPQKKILYLVSLMMNFSTYSRSSKNYINMVGT